MTKHQYHCLRKFVARVSRLDRIERAKSVELAPNANDAAITPASVASNVFQTTTEHRPTSSSMLIEENTIARRPTPRTEASSGTVSSRNAAL